MAQNDKAEKLKILMEKNTEGGEIVREAESGKNIESGESSSKAETPAERVTKEEAHKIMAGKNIEPPAGLVTDEEMRKIMKIRSKN